MPPPRLLSVLTRSARPRALPAQRRQLPPEWHPFSSILPSLTHCGTAAEEPRRRVDSRGRRGGGAEVTKWLRRRASETLGPRGAEEPPGLGLREAHAVVHRLQGRLRRAPRLLGSDPEQPLQLPLVRAQRLGAFADRRQQPHDRPADSRLAAAARCPLE